MQLSRRKKALFALVTCVFFFGVGEGVLRLCGFQRNTSVESMSFTFPIDDDNRRATTPFLQRALAARRLLEVLEAHDLIPAAR